MTHRFATACLLTAVLLLALAPAAETSARPSDRACLIAWNATSNRPNRVKLLALRPLTSLALRAGVVSTDTWKKGASPTQTSAAACLLTVVKRRTVQIVTGRWRTGHVGRWSFGHVIPATMRLPGNVRLLPDGRLTKIYLR